MFDFLAVAAMTTVILPHLLSPVSAPARIPADFFRHGGHYGNYVSLVIDPEGNVADCKISETKGNLSDDGKICPDVRRVKFSSAMFENSQSVYSKIDHLFIWPDDHSFNIIDSDINLLVKQIPPGLPIHPRTEVALDVDPQGKVLGCKVASTSGSQVIDRLACEKASTNATVKPVKDEKGSPVRSVQSIFVGFGAYTKLVTKRAAGYKELGDAGPYFPDRAIRLNVQGYTILECTADTSGLLADCSVDEEVPLGFSFGKTALKMAKDQWMRVDPAAAGRVLLMVDYPKSGNFLPPSTRYQFPN